MAIPLATLGQFRVGTTEYAAGRVRTEFYGWYMVRKQYGNDSSTYSYARFSSKADYLSARANPDAYSDWHDEPYSAIDYSLLLLPMATPLPTSTAAGGAVATSSDATASAAGISTEAAQDKQITLLEQLLAQPASANTDRATETTQAAVLAQLMGTLSVGIDGQVTIANFPSGFHVTVDNPTVGLTNEQLRATPVSVTGAFFQATQPVSLAAVPLAANAATAALQMAGNASLADISSKLGGTLTVAYPALQQVAGTVGIAGTVPVSGPLTDIQLRASRVPVDVPFPASQTVAFAAPQHVVVDNQPTSVAVSNFPATQPVSLASNTPDVTDRAARLLGHVTVDNQPSTLAISNFPASQAVAFAAPQHVIVDNQPAAVANQRVTVDNPTTTVAVSNLPAVQPVSLAVNSPDVTDRAARLLGHVTVDNQPSTLAVSNFPATQPVSATALPLPTGAATAALQTTGNTALQTLAANSPALINGATPVVIQASALTATVTNGPVTPYSLVAATGNNATLVKTGAVQLTSLTVTNATSSYRYLMLYNLATAPATGATPFMTLGVPPNQSIALPVPSGKYVAFSTGLAFAVGTATNLGTLVAGLLGTTGVTANDMVVNLTYA
jgi:hypothetical protein